MTPTLRIFECASKMSYEKLNVANTMPHWRKRVFTICIETWNGASTVVETARSISTNESKKAARFLILRGLFCSRIIATWINFISKLYRDQRISAASSSMINKPLRSYVNREWSVFERVDKLKQHYSILLNALNKRVISELLTNEEILLSSIPGKRSTYNVTLSQALTTRQEGELSVQILESGSNLLLCRISFLLCGDAFRGRALIIGGLQGSAANVDKSHIVNATRDMGGMRPKQCALEVVQCLADYFRCSAILAVSNKRHVIAGNMNHKRDHKLKANYDNFWIERRGYPDGRGMYLLPIQSYIQRQGASVDKKAKVRLAIASSSLPLQRDR